VKEFAGQVEFGELLAEPKQVEAGGWHYPEKQSPG
jgi:hypothetical protein